MLSVPQKHWNLLHGWHGQLLCCLAGKSSDLCLFSSIAPDQHSISYWRHSLGVSHVSSWTVWQCPFQHKLASTKLMQVENLQWIIPNCLDLPLCTMFFSFRKSAAMVCEKYGHHTSLLFHFWITVQPDTLQKTPVTAMLIYRLAMAPHFLTKIPIECLLEKMSARSLSLCTE